MTNKMTSPMKMMKITMSGQHPPQYELNLDIPDNADGRTDDGGLSSIEPDNDLSSNYVKEVFVQARETNKEDLDPPTHNL